MLDLRRPAIALMAAASVAVLGAIPGTAQTTIKAVMHSDVKILDPIWTTAYIQPNFGYMVWDTLFAMDEKFEVKPQMVDKYEVSADKLTWTFTLRDGLEWHDGKPVTSADCVPSIKRWMARDPLGKPSSNTPFMMPKAVAETDPFKQIDSTVGSGPFIYVNAESKPGDKHIYIKNPKYKTR